MSIEPANQAWPTSMDPALMTPAMNSQGQMGPNPGNIFGQAPSAYMGGGSPPGNMPL